MQPESDDDDTDLRQHKNRQEILRTRCSFKSSTSLRPVDSINMCARSERLVDDCRLLLTGNGSRFSRHDRSEFPKIS